MAVKTTKGKQTARIIGRHTVEIWRQGRLIHKEEVRNGIVDEGADYVLEAAFLNAATGVATWFIGLITNPGTLDPTDTLASHAGWTEWTDYDEVNRPAWTAVAASRSISNTAAPAEFTINAGGTVKGILVASVNTGTSGLLWSTANFTSPIVVIAADVIKVTYSVSVP